MSMFIFREDECPISPNDMDVHIIYDKEPIVAVKDELDGRCGGGLFDIMDTEISHLYQVFSALHAIYNKHDVRVKDDFISVHVSILHINFTIDDINFYLREESPDWKPSTTGMPYIWHYKEGDDVNKDVKVIDDLDFGLIDYIEKHTGLK